MVDSRITVADDCIGAITVETGDIRHGGLQTRNKGLVLLGQHGLKKRQEEVSNHSLKCTAFQSPAAALRNGGTSTCMIG